MKCHHDTLNSKGTTVEAKNHFLTIDKSHNSVINYRNLPINYPKRDIFLYKCICKIWMKSVYKYLSYRTETKSGRTDVGTTDRRTDRHTDGQRENIIPRHERVAGYKKRRERESLNFKNLKWFKVRIFLQIHICFDYLSICFISIIMFLFKHATGILFRHMKGTRFKVPSERLLGSN